MLASKPLLDRTLLPAGIVVTSIGSHLLRGKSERLELFALERGTQGPVDRDDRAANALAERDAATVEQLGRTRRSADPRASRTTSPTSPTLLARGSAPLVKDGP